jgi:hypothetical protein
MRRERGEEEKREGSAIQGERGRGGCWAEKEMRPKETAVAAMK